MYGLGDSLRRDSSPEVESSGLSLDGIFVEEPVPLDVFVRDKKFLANPPLSPVQYDAVRVIERVYYPDLFPVMGREFDPYWAQDIPMVNFITLQWGKGSGKDHICRIASLRVSYLLLCLHNPQLYYGMPEQDTITMLNIASSSTQAMRAFFTPMTRAVKRGWFKDRCEPKQNVIVYEKNLEAVSGHSDAESQEGGNLILGIADEIDAFRSKEELERYRGANQPRESPRSAEAILKMMRTSSSTRFPKTYKNVRISYPRYLGSTIQKLTDLGRRDIEQKAAQGRVSKHYVSGPLATWEVNPRITGPEDFAEDYEEDSDMAKAMYECKPSRAIDTYYRNMEAIRQAIVLPVQPISVTYELEPVRSTVTEKLVYVWTPRFIYNGLTPFEGAAYAVHADLAIKADKAGVSMSHVSKWETMTVRTLDETGTEVFKDELRPVVTTDFTISFAAALQAEPAREIQISWVRKLVFELISKGFNIQLVTYDGFQSTDSMQILETHGVLTDRMSTDKDPSIWKTYRDVAYEGRHRMPFSQLLMNELESLGNVGGGKVDHPPDGSKDEADSLVCSVNGALQLGGEESPDGERAYPSDEEFSQGYLDTDLAGLDYSTLDLPEGFTLTGPKW